MAEIVEYAEVFRQEKESGKAEIEQKVERAVKLLRRLRPVVLNEDNI